MSTFPILFKGGLVQNVEADGYKQRRQRLLFFLTGDAVLNVDAGSVIMVGATHFPLRLLWVDQAPGDVRTVNCP